jgi:hypothetical protein
VAAVFAAATQTSAHRLDELLQAARIGIDEKRVDLELDVTPGAAVADRLINEIDRDGDGTFSIAEQRSFVDRVFAEIQMTVDDNVVRVSPRSFAFPAAAAFQNGDGVIAIRASATLPVPSEGAHRLEFDNGYRRDISVYLANALVPETNRVAVTGQERDGIQSRLRIAYDVRAQQEEALRYAGLSAVIAAVAVVARKSLLTIAISATDTLVESEFRPKCSRRESCFISRNDSPLHRA